MMDTPSDLKDWPVPLKQSVAVDSLARALYVARCEFHQHPIYPWADVAPHLRAGYVELALRTLRALKNSPTPEAPDALFDLATQLARKAFRVVKPGGSHEL